MKILIAAAGILVLLASGGNASAQHARVDSKIQDNIVAGLVSQGDKTVLGWRFVRPGQPIDIKSWFGSRPLPDLQIQPYPGPTDKTSVIALLDVGGGPQRALDIQRGKLAMLEIGNRARSWDDLYYAVYGLEGLLLKAQGDNPVDLLALLMQFPPLDQPSNLTGAIVHAVRQLQATPTSRRAIFVLTDGHNQGTLALNDVRDLAISTGVIVNFLMVPGTRQADVAQLEAMAAATGGQLVKFDDLLTFLADPFANVDSGGFQDRSLQGLERYFWERNAKFRAAITYGPKALELAVDVDLPRASFGSTMQHVLSNHPVIAGGTGIGVIAIGAGAAMLLTRRRRGGPASGDKAEAADRKVSRLEDIGTGKTWPITTNRVTLGRGPDNDIVVDDASVSRHHAVIVRDADGIISIEGTGKNGTFVNHIEIAMSDLDDGDLITLGKTTFRFIQAA